MSSSIDKFKDTVISNSGFAKGNRFKVEFTNIPNFSATNSSDLSILCKNVSIPGKSIDTLEYSLYRNKYKVPIGYTNDDVEIAFNLTANYLAKEALDGWINSIIDVDTYLLNYDNTYKREINIFQLDERDRTIYKAKLKNAYPYQLQSIDLSDENENVIPMISAQFTYETIEITKT